MSFDQDGELVKISNANQAASVALDMAMHASDQGTFAVGGLIVNNNTGEIIQKMHNNVLKRLNPSDDKTAFTWDPTAHGERQLVYWYYENRQSRNLPPPSELTVITSLDPCVMCTGALLTAGFNVGVVAIDDFAGINYDEKFEFHGLLPELQKLAKDNFGYYACGTNDVDPAKYVRDYRGGRNVAFCQDKVSSVNLVGCDAIFGDSSNVIRSLSSDESGKVPRDKKDPLGNPATLPDDSPVKQEYRKIYPKAFTLTTEEPRIPGQNIINELKAVAAAGTEGDGNAVAFLDPFGNLVLCLPGREKVAPVRTPFMEVTQAYAQTRWKLMSSEATRRATADHLTVPKYGTFLFLYAPDPHTAPGVMTLGAYGSTMEGPIPQAFPTNLQYVQEPRAGISLELARVISHLPPLYNTGLIQMAISRSPSAPQQALSQELHVPSVVAPRMPVHDHRHARHGLVYLNKSQNSRGWGA